MATVRRAVAAFVAFALCVGTASAQKKYDPGASDGEIKLGQTMPYSGPLSGFITLAKAEIAYFAQSQVLYDAILGRTTPVSRWNRLVFPAPLGPMTARTSPASTRMLT